MVDGHDKTKFSHHGIYRFMIIYFGLKKDPGTFQLEVDEIFKTAKEKYLLINLEDRVLFLKLVKEHMNKLWLVLKINNEKVLTSWKKKFQVLLR